jgi:hypothetical protein
MGKSCERFRYFRCECSTWSENLVTWNCLFEVYWCWTLFSWSFSCKTPKQADVRGKSIAEWEWRFGQPIAVSHAEGGLTRVISVCVRLLHESEKLLNFIFFLHHYHYWRGKRDGESENEWSSWVWQVFVYVSLVDAYTCTLCIHTSESCGLEYVIRGQQLHMFHHDHPPCLFPIRRISLSAWRRHTRNRANCGSSDQEESSPCTGIQ